MPFIDDKLSIFLCKPLRLRQLSNLQTVRLPKLDILLDIEYWFASAVANMRTDRTVFVAVEEEPVAVPFKYLRHHKLAPCRRSLAFLQLRQIFQDLLAVLGGFHPSVYLGDFAF